MHLRFPSRVVSRGFAIARRGPRVFARGLHASNRALLDFDPYQVLGVNKNANALEIKKAYYQLVKKYHPDVNKEKDAEKRFHKIQELYELLNDKEKRAQYDQFGAAGFNQTSGYGQGNPFSNGNPFSGAQGNPFSGMGFDFEDLFKQAFNQGGRGSQGAYVTEHVGDNIEVLKTILFKEAIFGTKIQLNYKAVDSCSSCAGSGLKKDKKKKTCPLCHGTGQSTHILGGFQMASTCGTCQGTGVTIDKKDECGLCRGKGVQELPKSTSVDLPCGIADGTRLRIPDGGDMPFVAKDAYNHVRRGDLIVRVHVKKDPVFERLKNKIILNHDIPMTTAALGGEVTVPTVDGEKVKLKVRPGVQHGRILTIPDKGVPINRNVHNRGDMDVVLKVKTLVPETPIQVALLEALADAFNDPTAKRTYDEGKLDLEEEHTETDAEKDAHPKLKKIGKMLGKFFKFNEKN